MSGILDYVDGMVCEPGAYRLMPMSVYHSQDCCHGPSVSSTGIRQAVTSPHAFWKNSDLNENRYPEKPESDSLILGKAAHSLILGDEEFAEQFIFAPQDAPPRPTKAQVAAYERNGEWTENAKSRAAFWKHWDAQAAGRTFVTAEQMEKITYMAENLHNCPEAVLALTGNLTEISMIWQDELTGLWLKSRPDCIPQEKFDLGDLKTFAPKSRDLAYAAMRSTLDWDYPMQMALACEGAEHLFGSVMQNGCMLIFIQTTAPYEPVPVEISPEAIGFARLRVRKGINAIAHGLKTGEWPFSVQTIPVFNYPEKLVEDFDG